jgi:ribose/xylose/arabinose/galactoside ABC-type transport system permease subunit
MTTIRLTSRFYERFGIGIALIAECVLFSLLSPYFFSTDNLLNVTLQISITSIIAVGMTLIILTAGIDLSVGSLVALSGIVVTTAVKLPLPFPVALALAVCLGLAMGALSGGIAGLFVTRFGITPFIVTLALMTVERGLAFALTEGRPVWELPEGFAVLGSGRIAGVPVPTLIMLATFAVAHIVLKYTRFGRYVYAVGGNEEAARLAGINTKMILLKVYVLGGLLTAVSGILLSSRMNSGQPNAGMMYELDVIAAVVVGGTSLFGGRGTVAGTFLGSLLIGVLRNGLNLLNVGSYIQQIVVGVVILLAVLVDQLKKSQG